MARDYNKPLPSTSEDRNSEFDILLPTIAGAYSEITSATPKYKQNEGREGYATGLTVARLYITGDRSTLSSLPGPAKHFNLGSYVGFFLQEVTERNSEKAQVSPLNGDGYAAYFSGREPSVYSFSGILLNTRQDQWRSTLTYLYDNLLRGSKITGLNRLVQVAYDDKVVTGSMMNLNQTISASPDETFTRFSFDILVASVHDTWMISEDQFDKAFPAFIGDDTIFPDVPSSSKKNEVKSYTNSAYLALPPRMKAKGKAKISSCYNSVVTIDTNGIPVPAQASKIPESCINQETVNKLQNELHVLDSKIAKETDAQKKNKLLLEKRAVVASVNPLVNKIKERDKEKEEAKALNNVKPEKVVKKAGGGSTTVVNK
jgi:hypothetical protein